MGQVGLGIDTFGDVTSGPDGRPLPYDAVLRNVVEEGVLADQVGLDVIGVGEHHRADFAISAPEIVLAASPNPSLCSVTTWRTTRSSSTRSWTFSPRSCARARSLGRAPRGHPCGTSLFIPRRPMACGRGLGWVATLNQSSEQPSTASR
jgi:hypothetical protein